MIVIKIRCLAENKVPIYDLFDDLQGKRCEIRNPKVSSCSVCSGDLNIFYIKIIKDLKRAKLIDEDYPILCCGCFYDRNK